jgi:uncharacterized membrane protein
MRRLDRVVLGLFLLATFLAAGRNARADELTCTGSCGFLDNNGTFTSISVPGASFTSANGINDAGDIVGSFTVGSQTEGFLYNGSTYTPIVYPGASETFAAGINNLGEIVGYYQMNYSNTAPTIDGFVDNGGTFTSISAGNGIATYAMGINNAGQVVGYLYQTFVEDQGFVDSGGKISAFYYSPPGGMLGPPPATYAYGINDNGEIVGAGFVDQNGSFTGLGIGATGINDAGEIVGSVSVKTPSGNVIEGVVDQGGTVTDFSVPGSTSTEANGVNNNGEIVGDYASPQSVPAPEPGTLALLATGLVVLAGIGRRRRSLCI